VLLFKKKLMHNKVGEVACETGTGQLKARETQ
jgi:hypothetical protein